VIGYREDIPAGGPTVRQANIIADKAANFTLGRHDSGFVSFIPLYRFLFQCQHLIIFLEISLMVYNGNILTKYKKRSYFNECNASITGRGIYDFGDGFDHVNQNLTGINIAIANNMAHNISTEICFDLAKGVRVGNNWTNTPPLVVHFRQSTLHLIQSNMIIPTAYGNLNRLPADQMIIHADPRDPSAAGQNVFYVNNGIPVGFCPVSKILINSNTSDKVTTSVRRVG
jgi:hypothetical protein